MERFFNLDNPVLVFLEKTANLILLNLLWLVCCLPIVTIGPATTALYYVTLKMTRGQDPYIFRSFFHSFKENLKQGIVLTLLFLAVGLVLYVDFQFCASLTGLAGSALRLALLAGSLTVLMTASYAFPLLAQFQNTVPGTLRNALLLALARLPYTLVILVLQLSSLLSLVLFAEFFYRFLPLWIFLGTSLPARLASVIFVRLFAPLMPQEPEERS